MINIVRTLDRNWQRNYPAVCNQFFGYVAPLNYIAHSEALDAIDILDDMGLVRFRIKKCAGDITADYNHWFQVMVSQYDGFRDLQENFQNYTVRVQEHVSQYLLFLRIAIKQWLDRERIPDSAMLSQVLTARLLTREAVALTEGFFIQWKDLSGIDYAHNFPSCRLTRSAQAMITISVEVAARRMTAQQQAQVFFHKPIQDALAALLNRLTNDKVLQQAGDETYSLLSESQRQRTDSQMRKRQQAQEAKVRLLATKTRQLLGVN